MKNEKKEISMKNENKLIKRKTKTKNKKNRKTREKNKIKKRRSGTYIFLESIVSFFLRFVFLRRSRIQTTWLK